MDLEQVRLCRCVRYTNINPVKHYIKAINKESKAILVSNKPSLTERMEEEMFLGLRLNEGVSSSRFKRSLTNLLKVSLVKQ